jgi:hypothetical protein
MVTARTRTGSASPAEVPSRLADLLLASLEALAAAGQVDKACRLAGHACGVLRTSDPKAEHRFNALLHRLARRLDW